LCTGKYIQLGSGPPEDEQGMLETCRGLINVLYVNKQEVFASSW